MSGIFDTIDLIPSDRAGSISPRNTDTVRWKVLRQLPYPALPGPGDSFAAWPWGTVWASVVGLGPVVRNAELKEWAAEGLIERMG